MLDQATSRLDGKTAAPSTARRHRIILANAMDYAIELGLLETNPIRALKWTAPKVLQPGGPAERREPASGTDHCWRPCAPSGQVVRGSSPSSR